jgi:hypothetical protein
VSRARTDGPLAACSRMTPSTANRRYGAVGDAITGRGYRVVCKLWTNDDRVPSLPPRPSGNGQGKLAPASLAGAGSVDLSPTLVSADRGVP